MICNVKETDPYDISSAIDTHASIFFIKKSN